MVLSKKSKCAGCIALKLDKKSGYYCKLSFGVDSKEVQPGVFVAPVPVEKCPKPKDKLEYQLASRKRNAKKSGHSHNSSKPEISIIPDRIA